MPKIESVTKHEQIKSYICQNIIKKKKANEKIPAEETLAEEFGVHRFTVSKAVLSLIHEGLLYRQQGKGTFVQNRKVSSKAIGLLVWKDKETLSHLPFSELLRGVSETISDFAYHLNPFFITPKILKGQQVADLISNSKIEGLIVSVQELRKEDLLPLLKENLKMVLTSHNFPDISPYMILFDNFHRVSLACKHLIKLNHERIGLINGPNSFYGSQETLRGYKHTLEKHRLEFKKELVKNGYYDGETGAKPMDELLSLSERPTAIITADDMMAAGAMQRIKEKGLKIPEDISLIGGNNMPIASLLDPPLTTIKISHYQLGRLSAQMLLKLINNQKIEKPQIALKGRLIIRESCGHHLKKNVRKGARKIC